MSFAFITNNRNGPIQPLHTASDDPFFANTLSAQRMAWGPDVLANAGMQIQTEGPNPENYLLPIENLFDIEPAANTRAGFAPSNGVVKTVFMSFQQNRIDLLSEIQEILNRIDPEITLALYVSEYHPNGADAREREEIFNSSLGNPPNVLYLPSEQHAPHLVNDPVSRFPEDGMTFGYDAYGNPVVFGISEDRLGEVRASSEQNEGQSLINPKRSYEMANMTARMTRGLEPRPLEFLTYGGDLHVATFHSSDSGEEIQKQFFGAETPFLARQRIFSDPESLPHYLADLTLEQQTIYALAKVMEEIESIAGTASEAFPLGAGDVTIGETLATLSDNVLADMSPGVRQRLESLADYPLPMDFAGNLRLNYHVDIFMVPLTDNIVLVDEVMRDDPSIQMLLDDDDIDVHFLPSRSYTGPSGMELRTTYINMVTIAHEGKTHVILQRDSRDPNELSELDIEVRDMLIELGLEPHFTGLSARTGQFTRDYGLNCLTETTSFRMRRR